MYVVMNGDILEIRVVCWEPSDNQLGINRWRGECINPVGSITLTQIATAIDTAINSAYKAWLGNVAQYRGVGVTKILPAPRTAEEFQNGNAGNGTGGAKLCTQQTSGVISCRTGLAGQKFRGRIYPPFPSDTFATNDGNITGGGVTALAGISTAIGFGIVVTSGPSAVTVEFGLFSKTLNRFTVWTSFINQPKFGTQRRRGQFGRTNIMPF